jgi:hypothetical protein
VQLSFQLTRLLHCNAEYILLLGESPMRLPLEGMTSGYGRALMIHWRFQSFF